MKKNSYTPMGCVGIIVSLFILFVFDSILNGLVLQQLWSWFIIPVFHYAELTVPLAIGLMCVVAIFKARLAREKSDDKPDSAGELIVTQFAKSLAAGLGSLAFGYIVHLFVH